MVNKIDKNRNSRNEYKIKLDLWNGAWPVLLKICPFIDENDRRYYTLYKKLFYSIFEQEEEPARLRLKIDEVKNECGSYYDVYAVSIDDQSEYSLKISSPRTWIGLDIDIDNLPDLDKEEIVAYCLYEMSWFGFMNSQDLEFCCDFNQSFYKNDERPNTPGCDEINYIENFRTLLVECGFDKLKNNRL